MAEWGIAMSRWGNPFNVAQRAAGPLKEGQAAVDRARALKPPTPREQAYLDAVATLFANAGTVDQRTRIVAYRDAMAAVASANPADIEAQVFYALSIAGSHTPSDKTYANLLKAAGILEGLIEKCPQHPGLAHYIIHSYDVPALADRALVAARRYATIAPSAPRAAHAVAHLHARRVVAGVDRHQRGVGEVGQGARLGRRGAARDGLPGLRCAADRTGRHGADAARRAAGDQGAVRPGGHRRRGAGSAGLFALASMPARALERGDWKAAAALTPEPSRFFYPEAQTWFAKALGAARSGDAATTRAAISSTRIRDELTAKKEAYWAEQAEIQRRSATAWLRSSKAGPPRPWSR